MKMKWDTNLVLQFKKAVHILDVFNESKLLKNNVASKDDSKRVKFWHVQPHISPEKRS